MSRFGQGAHIVNVSVDHQYLLDERKLEQILMSERIKDLPVVVVSVAGAYRGGKSFLLNFFLRYLSASPEERRDGSWIGESSEPLQGFSWRGGSKKDTTGILMWSEPFVTKLLSGEEVAVLIMDTQGTFDSTSTVRDCSTIFALSTLVSSVQIYNLSQNIQEDHLQYLQLFTEYGRLVRDQTSGKPFQVLKFLVRDWPYPWEYAFGSEGGDQLLTERLQDDPNAHEELRELRQHIHSCFDEVSGFLMPHPGFGVQTPDFKGSIGEISPDFVTHLVQLVTSIFGPSTLKPKLINGEAVKARQLFAYFKNYMGLFNSNRLPSPTSIMKATAEVALQSALRDGLAQYEEKMDRECGEQSLCVPAIDVKELHEEYKNLALSIFQSKMMLGSEDEIRRHFETLSRDIENRAQHYSTINMVKQQRLKEVAKNAYEEQISRISNGEQFCVHPKDLESVHAEAVTSALQILHSSQKRVTDKIDIEEDKLKMDLDSKYQLLKLNNDTTNKRVIAELGLAYWQFMESKTSMGILQKAELKREHDRGLLKALEDFQRRRTYPHSYPEDLYEEELRELIMNRYNQIKEINGTVTERAIRVAVTAYNLHIASAWDQHNQTLHPEYLDDEHNTGTRKALESFRPKRSPSAGFDTTDEDERTLENILRLQYERLVDVNDAANKAAVQSAISVYKTTLTEREGPSLSWFLIVPIVISAVQTVDLTHHEESKKVAVKAFYKKRKHDGDPKTDKYLIQLVSTLDEINNCKRTRQFIKDRL